MISCSFCPTLLPRLNSRFPAVLPAQGLELWGQQGGFGEASSCTPGMAQPSPRMADFQTTMTMSPENDVEASSSLEPSVAVERCRAWCGGCPELEPFPKSRSISKLSLSHLKSSFTLKHGETIWKHWPIGSDWLSGSLHHFLSRGQFQALKSELPRPWLAQAVAAYVVHSIKAEVRPGTTWLCVALWIRKNTPIVVIFNPISVLSLSIVDSWNPVVVPPSLHHGQALARDSEQDLRQVVQEGPDGIPKLASKIGASTL